MHKILLVEDNEINRDMLTRRLQRHGFSVCCAHDGAAGVAMAASEMPDLILMDVALGEMDGWEATLLIKANPATVAIPIVALPLERNIELASDDFEHTNALRHHLVANAVAFNHRDMQLVRLIFFRFSHGKSSEGDGKTHDIRRTPISRGCLRQQGRRRRRRGRCSSGSC